jgi:hypothetical protein
MADHIHQLPKPDEHFSDMDSTMLKTLFESQQKSHEIRSLMIPTILFFILGLPYSDGLIQKMVNVSDVPLLLIKSFVFLVVLWLISFL